MCSSGERKEIQSCVRCYIKLKAPILRLADLLKLLTKENCYKMVQPNPWLASIMNNTIIQHDIDSSQQCSPLCISTNQSFAQFLVF